MKNFLTYGQLDYQCMKQAGNISDNDINPETRQAYVNTKLMKIYQMLDGLNDPFYNRLKTLTAVADQESIKCGAFAAPNNTLVSVTAATFTLVRSAGTFVAGSVVHVFAWDESDDSILADFWGLITSVAGGGLTAVYSLLSGTNGTATYATTVRLLANIFVSMSASSISVADTYFKNFVRISDPEYTTVSGTKIRVFYKKEDPQLFFNHDKDQLATKAVWWYQSGDTIYLSKGASANALGVITGEYRGKPALYTDATIDNTIDLPPENTQMLVDEVTASYLIDQGKIVPTDIAGRNANYAKAYEAAQASRAKAAEAQNK
jgi:hypothetical protein